MGEENLKIHTQTDRQTRENDVDGRSNTAHCCPHKNNP